MLSNARLFVNLVLRPNCRAASDLTQLDLKEGDKGQLSKKFKREDIEAFAKLSGDFNPIHLSDEYAKSRGPWCLD